MAAMSPPEPVSPSGTSSEIEADAADQNRVWQRLWRNRSVRFGLIVLAVFVLLALLAPWLHTVDPAQIKPRLRLKPPGAEHWLGTDSTGRDVWSRIVFGSRVSLVIGAVVAVLAVLAGCLVGILAGMVRWLDNLLMRSMDGMMAIPAILLAVALIGVMGADLLTICIAITIPEIPRVARVVRSVVLTVREEAYVEASLSLGTPLWRVMLRHVLPNVMAPVVVQAAYIASSAILIEAALSFLGIGMPDEIPSWGNIMSDARLYFQITPTLMAAPGLCIALTVLAINRLGDGLRDMLDPRLARSVGGER